MANPAVPPPIVVDCERIVDGFLAQPINAITSLAFVLGGVVIALRRPDRRMFGMLVTLVGVGSFLFHGPMPYESEWLHDSTIGWVLAAVLLDRHRHWLWGAIPALSLVFAVAPAAADPLMVVMAVAAVVREAGRGLRLRSVAAPASLGMLAVGAGIGTLSRTDWPWCSPDGMIQGHAVWHLLAAGALYVWGTYAWPREQPTDVTDV